jgi:hypothetical protein
LPVGGEDYGQNMRSILGRDTTGPVSGTTLVVASALAMAVICALDLTDGHLGAAFTVGFILVVVTAPMAVELRSVVVAGVIPPALLVLALFAVVLIEPSAVDATGLPTDAGTFARTIAAILDHGVTLVIGHGLALAAIVLRTTWGARAKLITPA